jgi:hypothetical protein
MLLAADGANFEQLAVPDEIDKSKLISAISDKTVIEGGNFNYKRLRFMTTFVLQIDFDFIAYKAFCSTLKTRRDEIAHGEQSVVREVSDCTAWHDPTLRLLDGLADGVLSVSRST